MPGAGVRTGAVVAPSAHRTRCTFEPTTTSTEPGVPVSSAAMGRTEHHEEVMSYVEPGKDEGRLVSGGGRPPGLEHGNYVAPTVFADVGREARIFQEETFGPVVAITPFDSEQQAVHVSLAPVRTARFGAGADASRAPRGRRHHRGRRLLARPAAAARLDTWSDPRRPSTAR